MAANALILKFGADTAPARQAITQLATSGASQMASLGLAAAAAGRKMDSSLLSTVAKLALAVTGLQQAFLAFGAVSAAALAIAIARMEEYRKVASDASKAGVSTQFFQQFTQAAGLAKEKVDGLAAALRNARENSRDRLGGNAVGDRLTEFRENNGFSATGDAATRAFRDSQDTETRIRAVIAAIDDLRDRGRDLEAFDLAEKLFGQQSADELISRANASGQSIAAMIALTDGKNIVSDEQIKNAKELEERLEAARKTMADGMAPIMRDLEALGTAIYRGWVNTEETIAASVKMLGNFYSILRNSVALIPSFQAIPGTIQQATSQAQLQSVEAQLQSLQRQGLRAGDPDIARLSRRRDELRGSVFQQHGRDMLAGDAVPVVNLPEGPRVFDPTLPIPPRRPLTNHNQNTDPEKPSGGSAREEMDAYEKLIGQIEKSNVALQAEYATLGLNRFERERAVALAKAEAELKEKGRELTEAERTALVAKIEEQARYKEMIEQTKATLEASNEGLRFFGNSAASYLSDIASGGENAKKAIMNLGKQLFDMAAKAALLGDGWLGKLLGFAGSGGKPGGLIGLFAGGFSGVPSFAVGTANVPNDMLANIHKGEMIIPKYDADMIRNGRVGGGGVTIHQNLDMRGSQMSRAEVAGMMEQSRKSIIAEIQSNHASNPSFLGGRI